MKTPPSTINKVKAKRQWGGKHIDVGVEVNESHLIIIEDKVGTGQHSDQLKRYREAGEKWCEKHGRTQLICVYIKTQSDSSFNYKNVEAKGFVVLNRSKLLDWLEEYDVGFEQGKISASFLSWTLLPSSSLITDTTHLPFSFKNL